MTSIRMLAISIGCSTLLYAGAWPSAPASAQVVERGVEGAAVGAIIGGIVGGGRGAATGAAIGGGVGVLSGAAEANARAQGYYGPPPGYGPPPPGYYGPPPPRYYRPPHAGYYGPPRAAIAVSINTAPPPLPVYEQPLCPGPGYIWTPGYWAYAGDYYWVPGTWVLPPAVGLVWTPGYWGYDGRRYVWNAGYWGPHVGYYGGINYGFGYFGAGYEGGYWDNGVFFYNSAVTKVDATVITHTYNKTVVNTATVNNVSFNGPGGTTVQPTAEQLTWSHEKHASPTALQIKHQRTASTNRALFASVNHGTPLIAATAKPAVFKAPEKVGPKVVAGTNPTGGPEATSQSSVDAAKNGTGQKAVPHGPDKKAPFAKAETGPNSPKQVPGDPHALGGAFTTGETGSDAGKHAPGNGGSQTPGAAYKPGSRATHGGTPVAQDGAGPNNKKNKHDQDNRPETTRGM
jgi:WXXGXW repeat (2 copies)